jgi:ribosome biogenesis protein Nip4
MKEYLREVRRRPKVRELFSRRSDSVKKTDARIVKSWKAVKFFNNGNPLFIGLGRGSSTKHASI